MARRTRDSLQQRRKRVILLALIGLALLVSPLFALSLGGPSASPPPARVVVQSGDTLWTLAREYGPADQDIRAVIGDIRTLNRLDGSLIRPGQVLLIETE
jgi:hypothetical protein